MMSHRACQTIYISITACTRLTWPLMADAIDHSQQHCNTQCNWVVYRTDWMGCMTAQKREFPALLRRQREDAFWQKASHENKDFSCCHRNDDQDCKKNRGRLCALHQRACFSWNRQFPGHWRIPSAFFPCWVEVAVVPTGPGLTFQAVPSGFPLDALPAAWSSPPISFLAGGLAHTQRGRGVWHVCRRAPWGCYGRSGQLGRLCMSDSVADCRKVHPSIHEEVHSCVWSCARANPKYWCTCIQPCTHAEGHSHNQLATSFIPIFVFERQSVAPRMWYQLIPSADCSPEVPYLHGWFIFIRSSAFITL